MKATFKSVAIALGLLAVVMVCLVVVDGVRAKETATGVTSLRVTAVDLDGMPIHNAEVRVCDDSYFCDNKGRSPQIVPTQLHNSYNEAITDWFTLHVVVCADGYVPSVIINCVVYVGQSREVTVKLYPVDGSELPYVTYVESPPSDYLEKLIYPSH